LANKVDQIYGKWVIEPSISFPPLNETVLENTLSLWLKVKAREFYWEQGGIDTTKIDLNISPAEEKAFHDCESSVDSSAEPERSTRLLNRLRLALFFADPNEHGKWDRRNERGVPEFRPFDDYYRATGESLEASNFRRLTNPVDFRNLFLGLDVYLVLAENSELTNAPSAKYFRDADDILEVPDARVDLAVEREYPLFSEMTHAARAIIGTRVKLDALGETPKSKHDPADAQLLSQYGNEFEKALMSLEKRSPEEHFLIAKWRNRLGVLLANIAQALANDGFDAKGEQQRALANLRIAMHSLSPFEQRTPKLFCEACLNFARFSAAVEPQNVDRLEDSTVAVDRALTLARKMKAAAIEKEALKCAVFAKGRLGIKKQDASLLREAIADYDSYMRVDAHPNTFPVSQGPDDPLKELRRIFLAYMPLTKQAEFEAFLQAHNFVPGDVYTELGKHFLPGR
jgi:hypothetical protein